MAGVDAERADVAALINTWLQRSGLKQHVAAQKAGLSESQFYNSYKNPAPQRRLNTDPDRALAVVRVFAERVNARDRCTAAEALRFLRLTRFPLDRYDEVRRLFPAEDWQRALVALSDEQAAGAASSGARWRPTQSEPVRHNLPARPNRFIGRVAEQAKIVQFLRADDDQAPGAAVARLLTLLGPAGVGKTRLALEVAPQLVAAFRDGVWFVDLSPTVDPQRIAHAVAAVLDAPEAPDQSRAESLAAALRGKDLLLVLDNCEHLIDACAYFIELLLSRCADLRILATSREPLRLAGERRFPVQPLTLPAHQQRRAGAQQAPSLSALEASEAVQLFIDRAQLIQPDFELDDDQLRAVASICEHLDGLPLALELAASRVAMFSVEQIAARLSDRFSLLTVGQRTAARRQQTLYASIDWSYSLLSASEQGGLRRLAVFKGGWSIEAAEDVADCSVDVLTELLHKSLVQTTTAPDAMRYLLLETIQQYAAEKLRVAGELAAIQQRHCWFYLRLAEAAEDQLSGAEQTRWLNILEREHDNLRAAIDWAGSQREPEAELRLVAALTQFWQIRGYWHEAREYLERAIARLDRGPAGRGALTSDGQRAPLGASLTEQLAVRAKALAGAGLFAFHQGDYAQAQQLYVESGGYAAELGDLAGAARAALGLGQIAWTQLHYDAAADQYAESLRLARQAGQDAGVAEALRGLARVLRAQGDRAAARAAAEECLALFRTLGDKSGAAKALSLLGSIAYDGRDYAQTRACYQASLALRRELDDRPGMLNVLNVLSMVALTQADYAPVWAYCSESLELARELGDKNGAAVALNNLGEVARVQGEYQAAGIYYAESLNLCRQLNLKRNTAIVLHNLGYVWLQLAVYDQALLHFRESLSITAALGDQFWLALGLTGLAAALGRQGQAAQACAVFGAAEALLAASGQALFDSEARTYPDQVAHVAAQLDPAAFARLWAGGRALSLDQALALATEPPAEALMLSALDRAMHLVLQDAHGQAG
jgi:predicted ATPase